MVDTQDHSLKFKMQKKSQSPPPSPPIIHQLAMSSQAQQFENSTNKQD